MERTTKARLVSLGVLLTVLAAGFFLGVAWERGSGPPGGGDADVASEAPGEAGRGSGDRGRDRQKDRRLIVERVDLTPGQRERVDSVVEIHRERMKALRREFRGEYEPRYRALVADTRDAIRSLLTAEQRATYDSLLAEHDRRREERGRGRDRR